VSWAAVSPDERVFYESILTARQLEVVKLVASGYAVRAIARVLNISPATVKEHLEAIRRRIEMARCPSPGCWEQLIDDEDTRVRRCSTHGPMEVIE
jgi:DNA-binding CsgD family transcriptional regulator